MQRDDLLHTIAALEALVADRELLAGLDAAERQRLMVAAGRVSHPTVAEARSERKAVRRRKNAKAEAIDRVARASTGIRQARRSDVFIPPQRQLGGGAGTPLETPRNCYVCKEPFAVLHHFYDSMCPSCAALNYEKRFQSADCRGLVAVITGARLKIGQQAALKLLRAGATVIATTRFPHDAAVRYAQEPDFPEWASRLHVHGLDLRHSPSVEIFCRYVDQAFDRLDVLINNAAQTVRRPTGFYAHLLALEEGPTSSLPPEVQPLLRSHDACVGALAGHDGLVLHGSAYDAGIAPWTGTAGIGIRAPAALSQLPCTYDDVTCGLDVFPAGKTDADQQQVDLRARNSWRLGLAEVPTPELIEVQLVNAIAPYILCARLEPLMARERTGRKHIVNVSAMEGVFSRGTKTDKHPHTNMAKAALNMMTMTSAPDYAAKGIFMNAVDTGWVTDEDPAADVARKMAAHDFEPPLDVVDGAARVLDPLFAGLNTGHHAWGQFFKDYFPGRW
jgi:NAD(P)-dependent dehydrogenase (short-subunit alcohol dehydrogenase family)